MQDLLEKIYRNLKDFFKSLDTNKRVGALAIFIFIMVGLVGVIFWAAKTRYEVLYSDLNKEDSRKIAIMLQESSVNYQTSKDSKTIMIPEDMINVWRLKLAMRGVTFSGTVGYEIFDKQSFGTTSFVQKINKQRALEGELVKTISYIQGIKRSRVHLSIPESSPFVAEKKAPSASVVIELDDGVSLTPAEVKGIALLISSAINGLRPHNVVIINGKGKKLSENVGDPLTEYTANRLALESKLNRQYESQIEEILGKIAGDGKVIAKVVVSLDYTQYVSTETKYDAEGSAVLSEVKNVQRLKGSRPSPQGIPGARSNLPGEKPQPGIPETRNDVSKELTTRNNLVPSLVKKSNNVAGKIRKISAAVVIDGRRIPVLDEAGNIAMKNGKEITKYEKWSEADLASFSALVASSIGIDDKRGDSIVIKNMEFAQEDLSSAEALMRERENRELIKSIVKYLSVGLVISLFFFLVVRPFVQWITDNTVESVEDFLPKTLEELEKVQANQKLPGLEEALPQIEEKLNPEKIEGSMLREKIISLVENNPAKAAQIVHEMIHMQESDKSIA